ncbi:MAG TPA: hypothetical protein VIT19_04050 [Pyrinomonadaceae bacterium]
MEVSQAKNIFPAFLLAVSICLIVSCHSQRPAEIEGPASFLETRITTKTTAEDIRRELGSAGERQLIEYLPPLRELTYERWGIRVVCDVGGNLRSLHVSKRWLNTIHGVRVGDDLNTLRTTVKIEEPVDAGDQLLALTEHSGWSIKVDKETGQRVESIFFLDKNAPLYMPR